jgi:hypothetical protein
MLLAVVAQKGGRSRPLTFVVGDHELMRRDPGHFSDRLRRRQARAFGRRVGAAERPMEGRDPSRGRMRPPGRAGRVCPREGAPAGFLRLDAACRELKQFSRLTPRRKVL